MIAHYVQDIRRCLENKCWFAALSLSLALPDICGAVEYPDAQVAERYIGWYDRYVARHLALEDMEENVPRPTGEVVYNLRNTFLHRGQPTVIPGKVKEPRNQVDVFLLILGDGETVHTISSTILAGNAAVRLLAVDVAYLCEGICECALWYYRNHTAAFDFGYSLVSQEALLSETSPRDDPTGGGDPLGALLEAKLNAAGHAVHIHDNVSEVLAGSFKRGNVTVQPVFSRLEEALLEEKASDEGQYGAECRNLPDSTPEIDPLREHQLRCLFGQQFREERYTRQRKAILRAVLSARTKVELNNNLTRLFPGEDVKCILTRLKPLIKDLPGR